MHPTITSQIAAEHIADLHKQAAKQRLIRELASGGTRTRRRGRPRLLLVFRSSRPIAA